MIQDLLFIAIGVVLAVSVPPVFRFGAAMVEKYKPTIAKIKTYFGQA